MYYVYKKISVFPRHFVHDNPGGRLFTLVKLKILRCLTCFSSDLGLRRANRDQSILGTFFFFLDWTSNLRSLSFFLFLFLLSFVLMCLSALGRLVALRDVAFPTVGDWKSSSSDDDAEMGKKNNTILFEISTYV